MFGPYLVHWSDTYSLLGLSSNSKGFAQKENSDYSYEHRFTPKPLVDPPCDSSLGAFQRLHVPWLFATTLQVKLGLTEAF